MVSQMSSYNDQGPMTNPMIWLDTIIALFLVLLRLYARIKVFRKTIIDDYILIFAMAI